MSNIEGHEYFVDGSSIALSQAPSEDCLLAPYGDPLPTYTDRSLQHDPENWTFPLSSSASNTHVIPPKHGGRFSKGVLSILRAWVEAHEDNPYPKAENLALLQERTGLDRKQITNWFANTRRRRQVKSAHSTSPQEDNGRTEPLSINARPGTPAPQQDNHYNDALQRWVDSPPENEPASFSDIVRAVASDTEHCTHTLRTARNHATSDLHSIDPATSSSASSVLTSQSSGRSSSQKSRSRSKKLQRRRLNNYYRSTKASVGADLPYQCTFCTETFKTKHDWQRHEKVLHLALERWVCAPDGPRVPSLGGTGQACCVFCGILSPDDTHIEKHHFSACQARSLSERTFHRKDHLVQHLRLVHDADCECLPKEHWKTSTPDVVSRCGFCALTLTSWDERIDHLADHFKSGASMSQWKGDWGFEESISRLVENSIPPYLIHFDRKTPFPMRASSAPTASPINAYELLKLEINYFIHDWTYRWGYPPDDYLTHLEACRIILASEALTAEGPPRKQQLHVSSWLRDLIMSSQEVVAQARFGPIRAVADGISTLKINGQDQLFERCTLEEQLRHFIDTKAEASSCLSDWELKKWACEVILLVEKKPVEMLEGFSAWIVRVINSDQTWLSAFKLRTGCSSEDLSDTFSQPLNAAELERSMQNLDLLPPQQPFQASCGESCSGLGLFDDVVTTIQPTLHANYTTARNEHSSIDSNFFRLFIKDLTRWVSATMSLNNPGYHVPSDEEIQHHARWIVYDSDDPWNQTAADHPEWLLQFKKSVGIINDPGLDDTTN